MFSSKRLICLISAILLSLPPLLCADGWKSRVAVVLAQTADVPFSLPEKSLDSLLQTVSSYLDDQFRLTGRTFTFESFGPVCLSKAYDNSSVRTGVREALKLANPDVLFSSYDALIVVFSGRDIWPQHSFFSSQMILDGKAFGGYCALCEGMLSTGSLAHEYSHTLGLMDLYDVDGDNSQGLCNAMMESLDLMDRGDRNDSGRTPAPYSCVSMNFLGIGVCDTLRTGPVTLGPLSESRRYLYCPTHREGEYFLMECRSSLGWESAIGGSGLVVYHVDRSESHAGFSTMFSRELTALERWTLNPPQVNCNPLHPCAAVVPSRADARSAAEVFWTEGGFSSDSAPAFRQWDGTPSSMALEDITMLPDGSVSFRVIRPLELLGKTALQDAVILSWKVDPSLDVDSCTVSWSKSGVKTGSKRVSVPENGIFGCIVGSLEPSESYLSPSLYDFEIRIFCGSSLYSLPFSAQMQIYDRRNPYPYIFVSVPGRMPDGTFREGTILPLLLYNCPSAKAVRWFFDSREISGYLKLDASGELRAEVDREDGTVETLVKKICVVK